MKNDVKESKEELEKVKKECEQQVQAAQFKADAMIQTYNMKKHRDDVYEKKAQAQGDAADQKS